MRTISSTYSGTLAAFVLACSSILLASCGGSGTATTGSGAATINLTTSGTSVQSDGSNTVTITATVLTASNSVLADQSITFTATSGQLSTSTGITDANGQVSLNFSGGPSGVNRTATITATTGGGLSSNIDIFVVGSTISANPTSATIPDDGSNPLTLTFAALNSSGIAVPYAAFTLAESAVGSTGNINFTPITGTADSLGKFSTTVTGVTQGDIALVASALGTTGNATISVTPATAAFNISGLTRNATALTSATTSAFSSTSMTTADTLTVTVNAPGAGKVNFVSSQGTWASTNTSIGEDITAPFSDVLTATGAGVNNVQVLNPANSTATDTLTVAVTATTPNNITLQASPSIIPRTLNGTTGTSTLTATVKDASNQPVGGAAVAFTIVNPTGGGETVSPVVAYTSTTASGSLGLGQATTTFTAGSLSSGQSGVQIRAQVLGTTVVTGSAPSGNDAAVVIGGTAGSVAFAQATQLAVDSSKTQYILPMSVTVADSNGNPAPQGTVVNLSLWPYAWSTGISCFPDPDNQVYDPAVPGYVAGNGGTFLNEDINENLILDSTPTPEDGVRTFLAGGSRAGGTVDGLLTPANSVAGTVPATVTTDANGIATFELTYPKSSAIWTVVRIRGSTTVMGGWNAVGQQIFRLGALESDASLTVCRLPDSPFVF